MITRVKNFPKKQKTNINDCMKDDGEHDSKDKFSTTTTSYFEYE
jgi:hypothetical protein